MGDDLRRRPPQPNRALDRRPAASQLAPGLGSPTPRSPIRAPHPTPAPAPRAPSTLTRLRFLAAPPTCLGDALGGSLPLPSAPNPAPVPSPTAPPVPTPRHAPAPRPWLPAAGRAPGAQAGGEEDVCPAERPRGAAAAGSGGAITAVSLFPWAGATDERAILLLTTNFSGSRRRQRCCAPQLPGPWRRPHQLGARSSAPPLGRALCAPPGPGPRARRSVQGAERVGAGPGAGRSPQGHRPRAQLHPARPPRPALYPARRAPGRRRRGSRPSHRLL